jgi:hypothetical protein
LIYQAVKADFLRELAGQPSGVSAFGFNRRISAAAIPDC